MNVLGVHSSFAATSHDSSAALVSDGRVISANEEERFPRRKTSVGYPAKYAIRECLDSASMNLGSIDLIESDGITFPMMKDRLSRFIRSEFGLRPQIELLHQSDCHLWVSFFTQDSMRLWFLTLKVLAIKFLQKLQFFGGNMTLRLQSSLTFTLRGKRTQLGTFPR